MNIKSLLTSCSNTAYKLYEIVEPIVKSLVSINVKWRHYQPYTIAKLMRSLLYSNEKYIALNSPTGSGKTLMILTSTLPLIEEGDLKLIISVRTRNQMNVYVRELKRYFKGKKFSVLIAKKDSCPMYGDRLEGIDIDCRICPLRNKVNERVIFNNLIAYDDVQSAIKKTFTTIPPICPYHSMKKALESSEIIIVSYPYIFDKRIREATIASLLEKSILVVDEAHNIDKLPEMMSIIITRGILEQALRQVNKYIKESKSAIEILGKLKEKLVPLMQEAKSEQLEEVKIDDFITDDEMFILEDSMLDIQQSMLLSEELETNWVRRVVEFVKAVHVDKFKVYRGKFEDINYLVAKPIEPKQLLDILTLPQKVVFMSGTLPRREYLEASWGVTVNYIDVEEEYGPVFPHSFKKWILVLDVSSRYTERSHVMVKKYCKLISKIYETTSKHILVVAPSYVELEKLRSGLEYSYPIFVESRKSTLDEVSKFIRHHNKSIILAVSMGKLVEGIEFTDKEGKSLVNTIIFAGLPYPKPDDYLKLRLRLLAKNLNVDYFTALKYYTAISINQAIGRLIRRDGDKALVVLGDKRFKEPIWFKLLGINMKHMFYTTTNNIDIAVKRIWMRL